MNNTILSWTLFVSVLVSMFLGYSYFSVKNELDSDYDLIKNEAMTNTQNNSLEQSNDAAKITQSQAKSTVAVPAKTSNSATKVNNVQKQDKTEVKQPVVTKVTESNSDRKVVDGKQYVQSNGQWVEYPYVTRPWKKARPANEPAPEIPINQPVRSDSLMYGYFNPEEAQDNTNMAPGDRQSSYGRTATSDYFQK